MQTCSKTAPPDGPWLNRYVIFWTCGILWPVLWIFLDHEDAPRVASTTSRPARFSNCLLVIRASAQRLWQPSEVFLLIEFWQIRNFMKFQVFHKVVFFTIKTHDSATLAGSCCAVAWALHGSILLRALVNWNIGVTVCYSYTWKWSCIGNLSFDKKDILFDQILEIPRNLKFKSTTSVLAKQVSYACHSVHISMLSFHLSWQPSWQHRNMNRTSQRSHKIDRIPHKYFAT